MQPRTLMVEPISTMLITVNKDPIRNHPLEEKELDNLQNYLNETIDPTLIESKIDKAEPNL